MIRPSRDRRLPGRRSVPYLIAIGAVGIIGAVPLLSAAPALADPGSVNITVQAGQIANVTLPGSGNYGVYGWPACGNAYWAGPAYTFDATNCTPQTTGQHLVDYGDDSDIYVNITVTPATTPPAAAPLALPAAPAAPSVTPGLEQLTISWTAADPSELVDSYEFTVDGGTTWTPGTSPTTLSGLAAGAYSVGVRAHNASGYGPASAYAPALAFGPSTPPTPPAPPTPPSTPTVTPPAAPDRPVATSGKRSISISWHAVTGATSYEYSLNGGRNWSQPTTHRSVTVTGLQDGRTYSVTVRALIGSVTGAASAAVSVTTNPAAQPHPQPAATPAVPSVQQPGSRGSDVVRIQKLLGIPADGIFGPQTAAAVRRFQAAHHLQVDGIVGRQTWTALLAGGSPATTTTTTTTTATTTAAATLPWLRLGSAGSYVREAQQRLGGLVVDGIFGARTLAAVLGFQSQHHLQVDGIVGTQTWAALLAR